MEAKLGDPVKAKERLGWNSRISLDGLVKEIVMADQRDALCRQEGFHTFGHHE